MKTTVVVLALLLLGAGVTVVIQHRQFRERLNAADSGYARWSNRWQQSQETLSVAAQTSARLHTTVLMRETMLALTSNELAGATNRLAEAATVLAEQQAELKAAADELQRRDERVIQLQAQQQALERQRDTLQAEVRKVSEELAELNRQREAATAARAQLEEQLKTLQSQIEQRQRTVDALNLERELTLQQNEKLHADVAAMKAAAAKVKQSEEQIARLLAQWNDVGAVRTQLQKLQQPPASAVPAQPK